MVQYAAERPRPRKDEANASDIGQDGDSMIKLRRTDVLLLFVLLLFV